MEREITADFKAIKKSFKKYKNKKFKFKVYADSVACYGRKEGDKYLELNIVSESMFFDKMKPKEIVHHDGADFIEFSVYKIRSKDDYERLSRTVYLGDH